MSLLNRGKTCGVACFGLMLAAMSGTAPGDPPTERPNLTEPVYRVTSKLPPSERESLTTAVATVAPHPLDPALEMARHAQSQIDKTVRDYTCTLIKRERINGKLLDHEYMQAKIRHAQMENGKVVKPFAVYLKFLKPAAVRGREVIYVEGANQGNVIAKEAGLTGRFVGRVELPPTGMLAMRNNRYPITEIGIETLVERLIEKGERDRKHDECEVHFYRGSKISDRTCTCLEVVHPQSRAHFDFNVAKIYIDDEFNVPIRYEAYSWPAAGTKEPELLEEYTYLNLKFNVGLTDLDFDPANPAYGF